MFEYLALDADLTQIAFSFADPWLSITLNVLLINVLCKLCCCETVFGFANYLVSPNFRLRDFRLFLDQNQIDFSPFFSRMDSEDLGLTYLVRNLPGSSTDQIGCCAVY